MILYWLFDRFVDLVVWVVIPVLFVLSAVAPFWFTKKILKRQLTAPNIAMILIMAAGLIALDIYLLYQAFI